MKTDLCPSPEIYEALEVNTTRQLALQARNELEPKIYDTIADLGIEPVIRALQALISDGAEYPVKGSEYKIPRRYAVVRFTNDPTEATKEGMIDLRRSPEKDFKEINRSIGTLKAELESISELLHEGWGSHDLAPRGCQRGAQKIDRCIAFIGEFQAILVRECGESIQ